MSAVIPALIYRSTRQKYLTCQRAREKSKLRIKGWDILAALVGLLLGQATLLEGLSPFGVAYLVIFINLHPQRLAVITCGVGLGMVIARGWTGLGIIGSAMLAIYILRLIKGRIKSDLLKALLLGGFVFGFHMLNYFVNHGDFYQLLMGILEPLLIFFLAWLFAGGLADVFAGKRKRLDKYDVVAILFLMSGIVVGLPILDPFGVELPMVMANFLVLTVAYAGGIPAATVLGMFMGGVLSLTGYYDPSTIGLYGFIGLMTGFCREYGRFATVVGMILTLMLFAGLGVLELPLKGVLLGGLLAGAVFFLLPGSVPINLRHFLPGTGEIFVQETNHQQEQQRQFTERLAEISQVFAELGATFEEVIAPAGIEEDELSNFLYIISSRICKGCEYAQHCWDKQFYQTYTQIFKLMTVLESQGQAKGEDFIRLLKGHCRNLTRLKNMVDGSLEIYYLHRHWSQKLKKQQGIVAEQLTEVSQIVAGLTKELDFGTSKKEDLERLLKIRFEENGLKMVYCRLTGEVGEDLHITLSKEKCMGEGECRRVSQVVNQTVRQPMTNYEHKCGRECGQSLCHFKYSPARKFKVVTGFANKPKDGETVSGDTFVAEQLKSGKYMTILCDGMGKGESAARESGAAARLTDKIIRAGFNHDLAVRTVNSALLIRSLDECFVTMDLALLDLFNGEIEVVKIGAVDSYIKRGTDVSIIHGGSLPAGILESVEPISAKRKLQAGDVVIMISDGVVDAVLTPNKEEWMIKLLKNATSDHPEELANYILEQAKGSNPAEDDMTVVVLKLEEERMH